MKELSVLVCDDSESVRTQMIETLQTIGVLNIFEASDGNEALLICQEKKPDLVFMDIIMPNKDGIAALKEINQFFPEVKVIMASSTNGQAHLKKSKLLGAYTFMRKPISENTVRDIITKYLEERETYPYKV